MIQTEKVLEFDKIKKKWGELALTEWAKEKIKDTVPGMSENELIARGDKWKSAVGFFKWD